MQYRDLGSTGIKVSALGFGAMRLPTIGEGQAKASADFCIECEECVAKCPQNIPIPERMKDVAVQFAKEEVKGSNSK